VLKGVVVEGGCGRRGDGRRSVRRGVCVAVDVRFGRRRRERIVNGMLYDGCKGVFYKLWSIRVHEW